MHNGSVVPVLMEYGRRFRPSALRVNFNVGIPSFWAVLGCHLVNYNQFEQFLAITSIGVLCSIWCGGLVCVPWHQG